MARMQSESEYPLFPLVVGWMSKIKLALKFKKSHFQEQADESMKFYECGKELNELMWSGKGITSGDEEDLPAPKFRMVVGKVAEIVELFGPALYHKNPTIVVEPKTLDIPLDLLMSLVPPEMMMQAQQAAQMQGIPFDPNSLFPPDPAESSNKMTSLLLQYYLDYIQRENDKKTNSRRMIDEALIKGAGVLWTRQFQAYDTGPKLVGSFYDTVDNLVIDPDCETLEEALWIAQKFTRPVWDVAEEFGISEDFLEKRWGTAESGNSQGERDGDDENETNKKRKTGKTNDLIEYWVIYSKMGMGHKLSKIKNLEDLEETLDSFGDNCRIVVSEKIPYPLNFTQKKLDKWIKADSDKKGKDGKTKRESVRHEIFMDCQWPIPFWADGAWPVTLLAFHEIPNNPWPMSHVKPALGYLKFINWAMSFLANKVRTSCRTLILAAKALEEEWTSRLSSGKDYEILEVSQQMMNGHGGIDVSKMAVYVQPPPFQQDIWKVLEAIFDLFDKATGLTELAYGASGGNRSAAEAQIKEGNRSVRPDDMANKVEDTLSLIARKEAMAARWLMEGEDVLQVLGERGANLWEKYVMSNDIEKVAREFNYRVEAGSARKPNKETQVQNMNAAIQQWGPILFPYAFQTGNVQIVNAFLEGWCKANDLESKKFLLPPPPPPQPNPEQMKIMAEIEQGKEELGLKKEEMQMKLQMEAQKGQMQLQATQAKTQADIEQAKLKMQVEREKAQQEMALKRAEMVQELQLGQAKMGMEAQQGQQQMQLEGQKASQQMQVEQQKGQVAVQQGQQKMQLEGQKGKQQMALEKQAGQQQLKLGEKAHAAKIKQGEQQSKAKVQQTKAQAAAKPKPPPKSKKKGTK